MGVFLGIAVGLAALFLLWLWAVGLRKGERQMAVFRRYRYAHRGLHNIERRVPENSLLAFRYAVAGGFGAELDVRLTADKRLAVVHDSFLDRLCGVHRRVEEQNLAQLRQLSLLGTEEKIPLLEEVLPLFEGHAPVILELKAENGNWRELCVQTERLLSAVLEAGFDYHALPVVMMGGGASVVSRHIRPSDGLCRTVSLLDDRVNAQGYERAVAALWGDDAQG